MTYGGRNPVRAGIVRSAGDYPWCEQRRTFRVSMKAEFWTWIGGSAKPVRVGWTEALHQEDAEAASTLPRCTYAGSPFGDERFVAEIARQFGATGRAADRQRKGPPPWQAAT